MARFLFGAAVWGCLRLRDIPDWGRWKAHQLVFWDETYIDGVSRLALAGEKVRSVAELDAAIAGSFDMPGIRPLWIHEDLVPEVQRCWEEPRKATKNRWKVRAPAMIVGATAAAMLAGLVAFGEVPNSRDPVLRADRDAARSASVLSVTLKPRRGPRPAAAARAVRPRTARFISRHAHRRTRAGRRPAYAVAVGTFATASQADRMVHLVRSKGYLVVVVPRGTMSQVTTPPYRTRAQAERVIQGLEAAGLHAHLSVGRTL